MSTIEFLREFSADITAIRWSRTVREREIIEPHDPWFFKVEANYGGGFKNYYSHLKFMYFTYTSLKRIKPDVVYACDLDTLIPTLVWGQRKSYLLIFDQFDPLSAKLGNRLLSGLLDRLELAISRKAHFRVTPNLNRIGAEYANDWFEVKNLFEIENPTSVDRPSFKYFQLFYGGVLSKDRGLIALSSAVVAMPRWQFQVFGQGPEFIELKTTDHPRIMAGGLIDHKLLMQNAQKANIYSALYDPKFKHNQETASNKLYEAAQLGVPLLAAKNTHLGEIVERFGLGWTVHYDNVQEIIGVLAKYERLESKEIFQIRRKLRQYYEHQLISKKESLIRLSTEVKRALEA